MLSFTKGLCLSCPESNQTIETDLQEIGPSILYAPSFVYRHIITSISYRIEAATDKNYNRYSKNYDSLMRIYNRSITGKSGVFDSLIKLKQLLSPSSISQSPLIGISEFPIISPSIILHILSRPIT